MHGPMLAELIAQFLDWCRRYRRPRTVDFYKTQLTQWLHTIGDKEVTQCRAVDLLLHGAGWHRWVAVQRLFNWAAKKAQLIAANPFAQVEKPRLGQRKLTLTPRRLAQLRRRAAADFRQLILCCQETACRPQEARTLDWDMLQVSDQERPFWAQVTTGYAFFVLSSYKAQERRGDGGPSRVIPVSPRLGRLLFRLHRRGQADGFILRTSAGKAWTKNALICRMRRIRRHLGTWATGHSESVVLYTLRHTAATAWAAEGVPGKVLMELLGQRNLQTTQRYLHLERYRQLEVIRRLWQKRARPGRE